MALETDWRAHAESRGLMPCDADVAFLYFGVALQKEQADCSKALMKLQAEVSEVAAENAYLSKSNDRKFDSLLLMVEENLGLYQANEDLRGENGELRRRLKRLGRFTVGALLTAFMLGVIV